MEKFSLLGSPPTPQGHVTERREVKGIPKEFLSSPPPFLPSGKGGAGVRGLEGIDWRSGSTSEGD